MRIAASVFASFVFIIATFASVSAFDGRDLFTIKDIPRVKSVEEKSSIASVREAEIVIDRRILAENSKIRFGLFDNKTFTANRLASEGIEVRGSENLTWRGKILDKKFNGDVVITQNGEVFSGIIYSPAAVYEIIAIGEKHFLVELDQSLFPACAGGVKGEDSKNKSQLGSGPATDSGDRIDVLVVYTAAVRDAVGGEAQAQTLAQQSIDSTNTAYINSRIRQRVRLVGAQLTALVETGNFSTELSNLRADAATGTARNAVQADLVAMLTTSTAACGIGYLMGAVPGSSANGHTVTARTCAVGNLSFAHELGHNMGSQHNPENGSGPTFPYGFGHYINGSYRTVMSYVDPCTAGCTRVAYFSNPSVIFNGQPTGLDNARDNARSINNTADSIANYRYSGANLMLGNFNGGELTFRMLHKSLIWTSDNVTGDVKIELSRDGGITWTTLFNPTPNDNQEYFTFGTRATRQGRLRITSLSNSAISDTSVSNFAIR